MKEYDGDYIDACRSRVETQTAMFREVAQAARDHGDADVSGLEGALESLESEYFNNMLLVLEGYFVHRLRGVEGKDGNAPQRGARAGPVAHGERRHRHGGRPDRPRPGAERPRTARREPVRLTLQQYTRLSNAFFRELERRFSAT